MALRPTWAGSHLVGRLRMLSSNCQSIGHVRTAGGWTLTTMLGELLHIAEGRYGTRNREWTILGVEFEDKPRPCVWFPGSRQHVAVSLTFGAKNCPAEASFQLAHEVVHLLDPTGGGTASLLAEGVAVTFADEMAVRFGWHRQTGDANYLAAKKDVEPLLVKGVGIIPALRENCGGLSAITPDAIEYALPGLPLDLRQRLCAPPAW